MSVVISRNLIKPRLGLASWFNNSRLCQYLSTTKLLVDRHNKDSTCAKTENMSKKLRAKTPIGKLDELDAGKHPFQEKEPLKEWPDNTNPITGEVGGPRGPEPTRYGDWERKGRVTDF